jgi:hypothetical protein
LGECDRRFKTGAAGPNLTQIAKALAGKCPPIEIVATVAAQRPIFDVTEFVELLDRAKRFRSRPKASGQGSVLMDVVEEIVKASPELSSVILGESEPPQETRRGFRRQYLRSIRR